MLSEDFEPVIKITTKNLVQDMEITIADNGFDITSEVGTRIF